MKVAIWHVDDMHQADEYGLTPVFYGEDPGEARRAMDVPDDAYARWVRSIADYQTVQAEIKAFFMGAASTGGVQQG